MGKIIVGYDGRSVSDDALALARKLAVAYGDELIVAAAYGFEQHPDPDADGDYFQRRARYFEQTFARAAEQLGATPFAAEAIDDLPGRGLYMLAEGEGARIAVVGSTTRSRVGRALLGSTGEALLHAAPCAVAIAPRGYAGSEHPALGLIGAGFDGNDDSARAVAEALRLAKLMDAELELICVRPVLRWPVSPAGPAELSEQDIRERLERLAGPLDPDRVRLVIDEGDPAEALARIGIELDLLIFGSRGYGPVRRALLGSTGTELMRVAPCPVLVVPRGEVDGRRGGNGADSIEAAV